MNAVIQDLLRLQAIEFGVIADAGSQAQAAKLRSVIPLPVLSHYDRLRARDKKGVAIVRNQTCTGCYMRQPIGKITVLMRGADIQLCDSCGRYLYLPSEGENEFVEHVAATKPAEKPVAKRTRKTKVVAAAA